METLEISYFKMLIGFLVLVIPLCIFSYYKTKLSKPIIFSVVRMTIQLLLLGVYLKYLFDINNAFVNILWVLIMVSVASYTTLKRTSLSITTYMLPIGLSFLIALTLIGGYFLWVVIDLDNMFDAQYFVPICGMVLGNITNTNVMAINTYTGDIKRDQVFLKYMLANGATYNEAQKPFISKSLKTAFNPRIANMAVMGIVSMPGMMIGQILGGNSPSLAIKYQIIITVIIFTSSILSVLLSLLFIAFRYKSRV